MKKKITIIIILLIVIIGILSIPYIKEANEKWEYEEKNNDQNWQIVESK